MEKLYKILIVDDEEVIRTSIIRRIPWKEVGFEVVGDAENGEDALEKIPALEPDLVMTDIRMPYMDGLKLAEEIRKEWDDMEIVIFTGFDEFEYAQQAIKQNVMEYILKPVNGQELQEILVKLKLKLDEKLAQKQDVEKLRDCYRQMLPIQTAYFWNELIHGELTEEEMKEGVEQYVLCGREAGACWVVASVRTEIPHDDSESGITLEQEERGIWYLTVKNVLNEKLTGKYDHTIFSGRIHSGIQILFGLKQETEIISIIHSLHQACQECRKLFKLEITVGIGNICSNISGIYTSYMESRDALGYHTVLERNRVIYIKDVETEKEELLTFDEISRAELEQAVSFGDRSKMETVIDKLISKMECAKVHGSQCQIYLVAIFSTITQMMQKHKLDAASIWGNEKDYLQILIRCIESHSIRNFLLNTCVSLNENILRGRKDNIENTIQRAKNFILENYANPELSVDMLCDYLHISPTYFSTVFKKETGETYVSWMTNVRLEKAVDLLLNTEEKTCVIAWEVGYPEANYFSYVFKKKYGVSPSKFRNERKNS